MKYWDVLVFTVVLLGIFSTAEVSPQVGELATLTGPSGRLAPVTRGLPVDFVVSPTGNVTVSGDELKGPSWGGICKLTEGELGYSNGSLAAKFSLANHSGTSLQGVRFDFVETLETYTFKKPDGTEETRTRTQPTTFTTPCYFGDLADAESSVVINGSVAGIKLNPETVNVTIHAVVSGISFKKQFTRPGTSLKGCGVVVDGSGDVVVGEGNHRALWRFSEDGEFKSEFGTLTAEGREVALNPVSGEFVVGIYNSHNDVKVSADGTTAPAFASNLTEWPGLARFTSTGRLLIKVGNKISTYDNFALASAGVEKIAGLNIRSNDAFDLQDDKTIWVVASNNLVKCDADFATTSILVKPGAGAFGELLPTGKPAIRCSPHSEIYVVEEGVPAKILPRVSVFDVEGRFIRCFGMGGQTANFHAYLPGQLHSTPRDFAFRKQGRVYITQYDASCGLTEFIEF